MGTRCEIYIRQEGEDREGNTHRNVVELWKHWDGYPSGIKELLEDFAQFIRENVGDQPHRLFYAEDLSSMLIAFSFMESKAQNEKFGKPDRECYPDIRPKGNIDDAEYFYIVSVESPTKSILMRSYTSRCLATMEQSPVRWSRTARRDSHRRNSTSRYLCPDNLD